MEDVCHCDRLQRAIGERKCLSVSDDVEVFDPEDLGLDQIVDLLFEKSASGTDLDNGTYAIGNVRTDAPVPVEVYLLEERLVEDELATK
jgi:hypothetical protein